MSSAEETRVLVQPPSSLKMVRTLGGVAMISGLLIVLAVQATSGRIAELERIALEKAVFTVIPGATSRVTFVLGPDGAAVLAEGEESPGTRVYAGYDEDGQLVGVALRAAALGYADVVRVLYGYNPACECIVGMKVLESKETPGLGDKIDTLPEFLENFEALDATLNEAKTGLLNAIAWVKHGEKTDPWQIDGITGATISSKAVGKMLNESAQEYIPLLIKHLDTIKAGT